MPKSGSTRWTRYGVQYMLDGGFAAGQLYRHDPACGCPNKGGRCNRHVHTPGAHPPILEPAEWQAYLEQRQQRRGTRRARVPARLHGLVLCTGCGAPMQQQGPAQRRAYVCRTSKGAARDCPAPAWVRVDACEAAVLEWLEGIEDELAALVDELPTPTVDRQQRDRLARRLREADAAVARLYADAARRPIPDHVFDAALAELDADRQAAQLELDRLPSAELITGQLSRARCIADVWDDTTACRAVLVELLQVHVTRGQGTTPRVSGRWESTCIG